MKSKIDSHYNNIAIDAFAISSVLHKCIFMTLPEIALILPIIAHRDTVKKLSNRSFRFVSFEQYFIDNIDHFYNFNDRFLNALTPMMNAVQLLHEIQVISLLDAGVMIKSPLPFDASMGKRAGRIYQAAENIASMISGHAEVFYLNARIEL